MSEIEIGYRYRYRGFGSENRMEKENFKRGNEEHNERTITMRHFSGCYEYLNQLNLSLRCRTQINNRKTEK